MCIYKIPALQGVPDTEGIFNRAAEFFRNGDPMDNEGVVRGVYLAIRKRVVQVDPKFVLNVGSVLANGDISLVGSCVKLKY